MSDNGAVIDGMPFSGGPDDDAFIPELEEASCPLEPEEYLEGYDLWLNRYSEMIDMFTLDSEHALDKYTATSDWPKLAMALWQSFHSYFDGLKGNGEDGGFEDPREEARMNDAANLLAYFFRLSFSSFDKESRDEGPLMLRRLIRYYEVFRITASAVCSGGGVTQEMVAFFISVLKTELDFREHHPDLMDIGRGAELEPEPITPQEELKDKTIFNVVEAAAYTGLAVSTLYKHTHQNTIPHSKPRGKYIYFRREELDAWLLSNRKATKDEIESKAATYTAAKKRGL